LVLLAALFGVLLAQLTLWFVRWRFAAELPERMTYSVNISTVAQGIVLGVLISLLFRPCRCFKYVRSNRVLLLRDENNESLRALDKTKWLIGALSLIGLLGLAVWQAGSLTVGGFFIAGLGATSAVLYIAAIVLTRLLRRIKPLGSFALRQGINSLYRPGNQTRVILLAVGLGAFVVLTVQSLQTTLFANSIFRETNASEPFLYRCQNSQKQELSDLIVEKTGETPELTPTVRARVAFVNGEPMGGNQTNEVRQQQGQIGREFAVTIGQISTRMRPSLPAGGGTKPLMFPRCRSKKASPNVQTLSRAIR
jgi:putative ABC transport system permease protein